MLTAVANAIEAPHKYAVNYDHATYPVALTVVLGWHQRGLISDAEASAVYRIMYRKWQKDEQLCRGK